MGSCILDNNLQRSTRHCRCAICGWCWTPTAAQDPPPKTITSTDHDVSDVVNYEDPMRDDDRPGLWSIGEQRDERDAKDHADSGSSWGEAGLGSGNTAESKGGAGRSDETRGYCPEEDRRRYGGDECGQRRSGNGQAGSRTDDGPVTQKDPISNEGWSTQVEMEALVLAEKEYEIKKVTKRLDESQIQEAMEEGVDSDVLGRFKPY